jgi:hypothetical protein
MRGFREKGGFCRENEKATFREKAPATFDPHGIDRKEIHMADKLKQKIAEFVGVAKDCPENLQEKCFSILLEDYLRQGRTKRPRESIEEEPATGDTGADKVATTGSQEVVTKTKTQQEDIAEVDLHAKARQFLKKAGLSVDDINQLFYKQEGNFLPLYDDLKTTKGSESQIRIALLHALLNGMHKGDFEFNGETVRGEVQLRKCYDAPNFAAHFKNNKDLFEGFTNYNKANPIIRLSTDGKTRLAELIKDLR